MPSEGIACGIGAGWGGAAGLGMGGWGGTGAGAWGAVGLAAGGKAFVGPAAPMPAAFICGPACDMHFMKYW